ncbi:MAG: ABC transporter substrate-binding protein [Burkholderiales bacterium]|nr:ABC transporter substrate-binding protein [Burkholderiales bacterium]
MSQATARTPRLCRLLVAASAAWCFAATAATVPPPPTVAQGNDGVAAKPAAAAPADGTWSYAYVAFGGTPKYGKDFKAFDWVNPDAPKGGTLYLGNPDRRTSFDKFNPFTLKGSPPTGVSILMFETLAVRSGDEPDTIYGLLAEGIKVAPDKSSVTFRINPKAKFYNGDPVTAADIKYSFDMLTSKEAAPAVRASLDKVKFGAILDERTIRFDLEERTDDNVFIIAGIPVFSPKWGLGADGKPKRFDEIVTEYPITTGPYTIERTDSGRGIEFKRNPDYWARDLPVRKGMFNFDHVVYRLYRDRAVSMEAFKAGEFDLLQEFVPQQYVRGHDGAKWRDGRIVKRAWEYGMGQGFQAYLLNLRRPMFQDIRVREALDYTYDFEKINVYGLRHRAYSLFSNSDFAAKGLPNEGELKLLEPFRATLPAAVFGEAYVPPRTDTSPNALRENLKKARTLFEEAGWKIGDDGVMRNAKGEPFEFEYLEVQPSNFRNVVWQRNLAKLGIKMTPRLVDFALYRKRLEAFDFDVVTIRTPDFTIPSALDYTELLGSKAADTPGSGNFRGLKNPAVDAMLEAMSNAKTYDELRDAARALDRIVMQGHYQVPQLFSGAYLMSYWNKFGIPPVPKYYTTDESGDLPVWSVATWWMKDPAARKPQS